MLTIRLRRAGKKNYATYRIVVAQSTAPIQGKFIQRLGHYNPHTKEIVLDKDQLLNWIDKGAQPSNTVAKLMERSKIKHPRVHIHTIPKRAPRKEQKTEKPVADVHKLASTDSAPASKVEEKGDETVVTEDATEQTEEKTSESAETEGSKAENKE